jgi:hypothetical protein
LYVLPDLMVRVTPGQAAPFADSNLDISTTSQEPAFAN